MEKRPRHNPKGAANKEARLKQQLQKKLDQHRKNKSRMLQIEEQQKVLEREIRRLKENLQE